MEVWAEGADQAELREVLRGLNPDVARVRPPDIGSASTGVDAGVMVELVATLPAFLSALAALWTARAAARRSRGIRSLVIETSSGETVLDMDAVRAGSIRMPESEQIRRIRIIEDAG